MRTYNIVVIPGDGIGPEIMASALAVLQALEQHRGDFRLALDSHEAGAACYMKHGSPMTDDTLEACKKADAIFKGPTGLPSVRKPDGTEAGLLGGILRNGLDLYANVRPIKLYPNVETPIKAQPGSIDYVIVRENTEGLYVSRGLGIVNRYAATDTLLMTRQGVERIVRFAFDVARKRKGAPKDGASRVTCVAKTNVLKSHVFFQGIFDEVAQEYPDIAMDYLYPDAAAAALISQPDQFDVLVMENFVGDLLSDLGGATIGGLGMCPSGNYGDSGAYFEPVHGSAPSIAGKGIANPLSQVLSGAMMLRYLGDGDAADQLALLVMEALKSRSIAVGKDGCPLGGTDSVTRALVKRIQKG
jgi:3-isopropylmalate dehydrogenase